MGMVVRTNTMALNAYRQLGMNNSAVAKSLEKLSSGFRINRAGDDAAGLAISEKMKAQITGLETASSNAQDGISLIQTAEGNLTEVHSMLNRMVELAAKSANGTYTVQERGALQDEVDSLLEEIDRISQSANFNGTRLLDGSLSENGKTTDGLSRMLQTIFTTGNPVDQVGKQTILDGGIATPTTKTKFEIDFSDLKISGGAGAGAPTITPGTAATGFTATAGATANAGDAIKVKTEANTGSAATKATAAIAVGGLGTPTWANGSTVKVTSTGGDTDLNLTASTTDGTTWTVAGAPTGYSATFDGTSFTLTADTAGAKAAEPDYGTLTVEAKDGNGTGAAIAGTTGTATFTNGKDAVPAGGTKVTVTVGANSQSQVVADADWDAGATITVGGVTVAVDKTASKTQAETTIGTIAAGAAATGPQFDIKIGDLNLTGVQLAAGATNPYEEADIAQAILNKMANSTTDVTEADVTINGVEWTVKTGADATNGGLVFEMKDDPTDATKLRGDFAWDVSGDANTKIEGNHNAGTIVTVKGAVASAAARANTVFKIDAADIKDGTKIRIDNVTVTLAVGKNSDVDTTKAGVINLKDMEEGSVDLHNALSRISEGFKGYTTDFEVGVSDNQGNADLQTGLAVYKKATGTKGTYDTKEKLAAVFGLSTKGSPLTLQIGDTADKFNKMEVSVEDMSANGLGLSGLSIMTEKDASDAIDKIKTAINTVSTARAGMGALQNRLEHTINNLDVAVENLSAANSRIRDTDMAKEMMNYTKMNVLVQSAQAMLAQANQQPQSVLQLLQ